MKKIKNILVAGFLLVLAALPSKAAFIKTIESRQTLQPGATIYLSTGTILDFKASSVTASYVNGTSGQFTSLNATALTFGSFAPQYNVRTTTITTTALTTDAVILASGNVLTVNLYTAVGNNGRNLVIQKTDNSLTNIITVDPSGSETLTGASTTTLTTTLNTGGESLSIISNGSNWFIDSRKTRTLLDRSSTTVIAGVTSNPSKGGTSVDRCWWYRDGRYAYILFDYQQTSGGSAGSGAYLLNFCGLTADTTITGTNTNTGATNSQGPGTLLSSFKGNQGTTDPFDTATAAVYDSTRFRIVGRHSNTLAIWSSADNSLNNTTVNMTGWLKVPISGWNE